MKMLQEFRAFAIKGNVIDLAVGVIIGGAFSKIVDSVVGDVIMPIIAWLIGGKLDFSNLFIVLGHAPENVPMTLDALKKAGVPLFAYGSFHDYPDTARPYQITVSPLSDLGLPSRTVQPIGLLQCETLTKATPSSS